MSNVTKIYRNLLLHPGDKEIMIVLADALEEEGNDSLAKVYRWAARINEKDKPAYWPFKRHRVLSPLTKMIYDWDTDKRQNVEECARLPHDLFSLIANRHIHTGTNQEQKDYGTVNKAFKLLSKFLPQYLKNITISPEKIPVREVLL